MSSRSKKKGGLGVSRSYIPTVTATEPILPIGEVVETEIPEQKLPEPVPEEEIIEEDNSVVIRLKKIALSAFDKDDENALPTYIQQLVLKITLDDADVLWEFASMTRQFRADEDRTVLTDFYQSITQMLAEREKDESLLRGGSVPYYRSLVFGSPLLQNERRIDEERDSQLLRKDKPVRGAISCTKCGDNLISTRQFQLRGMDEPSTNIYTCYSCSNMWSN